MSRFIWRYFSLSLCLWMISMMAVGQEVRFTPDKPAQEGIISYQSSDKPSFSLRIMRDSYVYLISFNSQGASQVLFPNSYEVDNYLARGKRLNFPSKAYELSLTGLSGDYYLLLLVSQRPLEQMLSRYMQRYWLLRQVAGADPLELGIPAQELHLHISNNGITTQTTSLPQIAFGLATQTIPVQAVQAVQSTPQNSTTSTNPQNTQIRTSNSR
ncbi:MAG: DUF4384 domain-containing protein [Deinococcales bacterium]